MSVLPLIVFLAFALAASKWLKWLEEWYYKGPTSCYIFGF